MERIHCAGMPPLKVIVANGQIPMAESSNDRLADTLVGVLQHFGFRATRLRFPLSPTLEDLPRHLAAYRLIDLQSCDGDPGDVLICLDIPSAGLRHPNKVLWICHPYGGLLPSALSPTGSATHASSLLSSATRKTLERSCRLFLSEATRRLSTSASVAADIQELAELDLRTLWPPVFGNLPEYPVPEIERKRNAGSSEVKPAVLLQSPEAGYLPVERICDVIEQCRDHLAFACFPAVSGDLAQFRTEALFRSAADRGLDLIQLEPETSGPTELADGDETRLKLQDLSLCSVWLCAVEESSPWAAWNALARKIPLVTTTDCGASAEMARASKAGVVIEPEVDRVVAALTSLSHEPSSDDPLFDAGERASSFLKESYPTWESVIDDLLRAGR